MTCPLCALEKRTRWYYENRILVVLDCDTCKVPMVVLRRHTIEPTLGEQVAMQTALANVADEVFGPGNWITRTKQRKIKGHVHWHAVHK